MRDFNQFGMCGGFSIGHEYDDRTSVVVEPGDTEIFVVSVPQSEWNPVSIGWQSNDPDEPNGVLDIQPALTSVGSLHPDFTLPVVSANGLENTTRLTIIEKVLFGMVVRLLTGLFSGGSRYRSRGRISLRK